MQVSFKAFLYVTIALVVILFTIGAVEYKKRDYACFPDNMNMYNWGKRTEVFNLGSLHFYVTPFVKDCPQDSRYDPKTVLECGYYCSREQLGE